MDFLKFYLNVNVITKMEASSLGSNVCLSMGS